MNRLDLKVGFTCNNNCRFCAQAHKKRFKDRRTQDLLKELREAKKTCDGVVFTGGEPTIRPNILDMVREAKDLGYQTIQIQSNGRMFSSMEFCRKMIAAGATEFSPALHGHRPELHDFLTRSKGSFSQTLKGIMNLRKLDQFILTNTVVAKPNYRHLPALARLFVRLGVDQFQLAFVHAVGNAQKYYDSIVPVKTLAMPYIKKAMQIGIDNSISVMAEAIPFCMMTGYERYCSENFIPDTEIADLDVRIDNYTKVRRDQGKTKFSFCSDCRYDSICEGPWKEYPEKKGDKEFHPIR